MNRPLRSGSSPLSSAVVAFSSSGSSREKNFLRNSTRCASPRRPYLRDRVVVVVENIIFIVVAVSSPPSTSRLARCARVTVVVARDEIAHCRRIVVVVVVVVAAAAVVVVVENIIMDDCVPFSDAIEPHNHARDARGRDRRGVVAMRDRMVAIPTSRGDVDVVQGDDARANRSRECILEQR